MAAGRFQKAMDEVFDMSHIQAALFILGLALTLAPQKALKPSGPCADRLYIDYLQVVRLTVFFLFTTFGAATMSSHVKRRVPDGGVHGVATARARALLRLNAALACVLSAAASALAVVASIFLLQAKTGAWVCLPADVHTGLYVIGVVVV